MSEKALEKTLQELEQRVNTDEAFRQQFQNDPEGILLRVVGISTDEVRQHVERMSESELAAVAGGSAPAICGICGKSYTSFWLVHWITECDAPPHPDSL